MKQTVYVIGAGAGNDINMPIGRELKESISSMLNITYNFSSLSSGDPDIAQAIRQYCHKNQLNENTYRSSCVHISNALPLAISIDNFIDAHKKRTEVEFCAKLAIVKSILRKEKKSHLNYYQGNIYNDIEYKKLESSWYLYFFQTLTENCEFSDLENRFQHITLIIFNYDRCIEHFLTRALMKYYSKPIEEVIELINKLSIFHPYGQVGNILSEKSSDHTPFGSEIDPNRLHQLSTKIKTFTESIDEELTNIISIHEKVDQAERLIFLGFAFHQQNMKLLTPKNRTNSHIPECFASAFGFEENAQNIIIDRIISLYDKDSSKKFKSQLAEKIEIKNLKCKEFYAHYVMNLGY